MCATGRRQPVKNLVVNSGRFRRRSISQKNTCIFRAVVYNKDRKGAADERFLPVLTDYSVMPWEALDGVICFMLRLLIPVIINFNNQGNDRAYEHCESKHCFVSYIHTTTSLLWKGETVRRWWQHPGALAPYTSYHALLENARKKSFFGECHSIKTKQLLPDPAAVALYFKTKGEKYYVRKRKDNRSNNQSAYEAVRH